MHTLTREQKIQRMVKMRNKRARQELPLLSPVLEQAGFLTDEATEQARRSRLEQGLESWWKTLEQGEQDAYTRATKRREIIAGRVSFEQLAALDLGAQKWLEYGYPFLADYWWQKMKEFAPDVAQANCHLAEMHVIYGRWHDICPGCGRRLEKPAQLQMSLPLASGTAPHNR